jgi:anti-sigma B factor antagonist
MSANEVIASQEPIDDGVYLALRGDIDLSRSPELRQGLMQVARSKPRRLVVDLAEVPYMDSSGVATLVESLQTLRKGGGKMVLCALQPKVRSIFEIARLDMVFTIVEDRAAAVGA